MSAAHPPSTQWDANGKPVCIYLLPEGFVCAWITNFLRKTCEKKCKKFRSVNSGNRTHSKNVCIGLYDCSGTMYRPRDEIFFEN